MGGAWVYPESIAADVSEKHRSPCFDKTDGVRDHASNSRLPLAGPARSQGNSAIQFSVGISVLNNK
jgi:hypothetical protein